MLSLLLPLALAELPLPLFPECGTIDRPDLCPDDFNERWTMLSYIPEQSRETVREAELPLGSGNNVDQAWRLSTGRFDTLLAVMDTGVDWGRNDLRKKYYLNEQELPIPQDENGVEYEQHDANNDGIFNVEDYENDPRVDVQAGPNGHEERIDPSDLIATFSDGTDDDNNGYVDDISGWDFFEQDNDAYHTYDTHEYGDHGDGVAREVGAEGGNGSGIGVCPNCAILPVRVGDTFITDGNRAAEAIVYAANQDAVSGTMAFGALSNSDATTDAAAYAYESGMVLVGAAGDENSYHRNFPAVLDNILFVHSISHDTNNSGDSAKSYMNTWNCNNFGARMSFSAASGACATGAVAQTTGAVGLIYSLAKDKNIDIHPMEVIQLLQQYTTDIWLSEQERAITKAYPSTEGWDPFYGYGRMNVGAALRALENSSIPPITHLESPAWFSMYEKGRDQEISISFHIHAPRSNSYEWVLEYGLGNNPQEWIEINTGSGEEEQRLSSTLSIGDIPAVQMKEGDYNEKVPERLERVNEASVTIRLRVSDAQNNQSEQRKTVYVREDSDLLSGYPITLPGSAEASPILYDVDGDDIFEVIVADGSGLVHVLNGEGEELPGFPVASSIQENQPEAFNSMSPLRDVFLGTPSAADIDGDGDTEIVAAGMRGGVYVWHHDGTLVDGFPTFSIGRDPSEMSPDFRYDQGFVGGVTLADIDEDGNMELISAGLDSRLYVWNHDGTEFGPYPIDICAPENCGHQGRRLITSVSVGDIDNDGNLELGFGASEAINNDRESASFQYDAQTGTLKDGWPKGTSGLVGETVLLPMIGEGHPASLSYADIDGDGDLEIGNSVMLGTNPPIHHDGSTALETSFYGNDFSDDSNADLASLIQMVASPAWGDITGDGVPEYLISGVSSLYLASLATRKWFDYQQGIGAWDGTTGEILDGWPRQLEDVQFLTAPAIADVSGDGQADVIAVSGGFLAHAWESTGEELEGWPKHAGGWILAAPAVGDITGDGYLNVVVTTREGKVFAWKTKGHADQKIEWSALHHDAQNTGNYETELPIQNGPEEINEPKESGCCNENGSTDAAWLLLPMSLFAFRRRKS